MLKRLFPLLLLILVFAKLGSAAYSASMRGELLLFAPLVQVQPVSTGVPPTEVPPTEVPPTEVPPTEVPPTTVPPTTVPPTTVPPTTVPTTTVTPIPPAFPPGVPLLLVEQGTADKDLAWYPTDGSFRYPLVTEENNELARVSPDGERVVFQQQLDDFSRSTYVVGSTGGTPTELAAIGSLVPFAWSPNSDYITYGDSGEVNSYELSSAMTTTLRVAFESFEYVAHEWNPQNGLVYYYNYGTSSMINDSIFRNNGAGTAPLLIHQTAGRDALERILDDGRLVVSSDNLYATMNNDGTGYIVLPLLPLNATSVSFSPAANARFYKNGTTLSWENWAGTSIGNAVPECGAQYNGCFLRDVQWQAGGNELTFEWNRQGSGGISDYQLYRLALDGSAPVLVETQAGLFNATYSDEGQYLAYELGDDVVIVNTDTDTVTATLTDPDGGKTNIADWRPIVD